MCGVVFEDPRRARGFFEALVADNIQVGRPEQVSLVFARQAKSNSDRFGTRIVSRGTDVRIDFRYKHCRIKQYLKDRRALRVETVIGFTNKTLRALVAAHLDQPYNQSKMSYDLRRLRLHGLIQRLPHSNTYVLTPDGIRVAVFYNKLQNRLLRPLLEADKPPAPIDIRRALTTLEHAVNDYVHQARLAPAA
jgi:hypothetical protein